MKRSCLAFCFVLLLVCMTPIHAVDQQKVSGTYWVELAMKDPFGSIVSKTIQLTVTEDFEQEDTNSDEDTTIEEKITERIVSEDKEIAEEAIVEIVSIEKLSDYVIEAQSFTIQNRDLASLSDADVIQYSQARAYDPMTLETIPVQLAQRTALSKTSMQFDLVADESISTSVIGRRIASAPKTETISWESDTIQHDSFSAMNQIFFTSSVFLVIGIPLILLAILFGIYYHYKKKTQKTLYK